MSSRFALPNPFEDEATTKNQESFPTPKTVQPASYNDQLRGVYGSSRFTTKWDGGVNGTEVPQSSIRRVIENAPVDNIFVAPEVKSTLNKMSFYTPDEEHIHRAFYDPSISIAFTESNLLKNPNLQKLLALRMEETLVGEADDNRKYYGTYHAGYKHGYNSHLAVISIANALSTKFVPFRTKVTEYEHHKELKKTFSLKIEGMQSSWKERVSDVWLEYVLLRLCNKHRSNYFKPDYVENLITLAGYSGVTSNDLFTDKTSAREKEGRYPNLYRYLCELLYRNAKEKGYGFQEFKNVYERAYNVFHYGCEFPDPNTMQAHYSDFELYDLEKEERIKEIVETCMGRTITGVRRNRDVIITSRPVVVLQSVPATFIHQIKSSGKNIRKHHTALAEALSGEEEMFASNGFTTAYMEYSVMVVPTDPRDNHILYEYRKAPRALFPAGAYPHDVSL